MAVHLRLTRVGRHKRPFYRVVAVDSRVPRDGKYIELLGTYDPLQEPAATTLKPDRVLDWLQKGAQPSVTVRTLLRRSGIWATFNESKTPQTPQASEASEASQESEKPADA